MCGGGSVCVGVCGCVGVGVACIMSVLVCVQRLADEREQLLTRKEAAKMSESCAH